MEDATDSSKDGADFIELPTSNSPGGGIENVNNHSTTNQEPSDCEFKEAQLNGEIAVTNEYEHVSAVTSTAMQVGVEVSSTTIENKVSELAENDSTVQDGIHQRNGSSVTNHEIDAVSGIKRPRITVDEQQASVHVTYNSITRESKRKLEEFLQKWSEWHARHPSKDPEAELESGECTYFPALTVGPDKPSSVSFWIDGQPRNLQNKEIMALDNSSIPLYDRGYSFGLTSTDGLSNLDGGLEIVDGARCFNCGSYSHALKECPKPRDNAAVNNARKQHKTKRNQNAMSRNPTRYYQDTPGGKFDGLRPGVLDSETKKLLGLGELDPPPWLNRMREIGYPPGYLDAEDEEEPSGIEIIGEEVVVVKQEPEDGEILDMDISPPPPAASEPLKPELPKKMSVQFPGVNGPIPENADEWRWGARAWKFDLIPKNRSSDHHRSYNNSVERSSRSNNYHEERWNHREYRDDGPPGVEPACGSLPSSFSPRYDSRGSSHGRSLHDSRDRRSPLIREAGSSHDDDRWNPYSSEYLSHRNDRHEDRHRRSWR